MRNVSLFLHKVVFYSNSSVSIKESLISLRRSIDLANRKILPLRVRMRIGSRSLEGAFRVSRAARGRIYKNPYNGYSNESKIR